MPSAPPRKDAQPRRKTSKGTPRTDGAQAGDARGKVQAAREWLEAHADDPLVRGASLPEDHRRDPDTGEDVGRQQVREGATTRVDRAGSYSPLREDWMDLQDEHTVVLVARPPVTEDQLDKRARLERVMAQLPEHRQDVLRMRYFERLTIKQMTEQLKLDSKTVRQRLEVAKQDLYVAVAAVWGNEGLAPLELRQTGGRPARNRDEEQRRAVTVIEAYYQTQKGEHHG